MSRYRGKREAPRPERGFGRREEDSLQQDPFLPEEPEEEPDGADDPAGSSEAEGFPSWEASGAGV